MFERLTRLCLAFAIAFVFAGQMEAAAAHCVRLAQADVTQADAAVEAPAPATVEALPCHGDGQDMAAPQQEPQSRHHKQLQHHKSGERCECVGVLTACAEVAKASGASSIAPYEWARPEAAVFASVDPAPALRPPRA